jgi:hypothetical protein
MQHTQSQPKKIKGQEYSFQSESGTISAPHKVNKIISPVIHKIEWENYFLKGQVEHEKLKS